VTYLRFLESHRTLRPFALLRVPPVLLRPSWLATRLRVSPRSARDCRVGDETCRLPCAFQSIGCAGDAARVSLGLHTFGAAVCTARPVALPDSSPCCACQPGVWVSPWLRAVRLCRRWRARVASPRPSFGGADWRNSEVPSAFRPSVSPTIRCAGCPASRSSRLRLVVFPGLLRGFDSIRSCHRFELAGCPALTPLAAPAARSPGSLQARSYWSRSPGELPGCPGSSA